MPEREEPDHLHAGNLLISRLACDLKGSSWHIGAAQILYGAPEEVRTPFTRFVVWDHSSGSKCELKGTSGFLAPRADARLSPLSPGETHLFTHWLQTNPIDRGGP